METHEIGTWFLLLGLLFPRVTLLFWWFCGNLPYNTTPFIGDLFASILIPRILILVWIYDIQGMSVWFWIHFAVMIIFWVTNMFRATRSSKRQ